jgi:putative transposase
MPIPEQFKAPFEFQKHYHILFRSIDGIPLFKTEKEHLFFLEKWKRFTDPVFETWAYSLLDNHTQFLEKKEGSLIGPIIERQINSFMVSFTNTYNNIIERKGGLFQQPFRRSLIASDAHIQQAIVYVHANAQKHKLVKDFKMHRFNSYQAILDRNEVFINVAAVVIFFGGIGKFISIHSEQVAYFYKHQWPDSRLEVD